MDDQDCKPAFKGTMVTSRHPAPGHAEAASYAQREKDLANRPETVCTVEGKLVAQQLFRYYDNKNEPLEK